MKDYYMILGVSERATDQDVKAAYRKLAKRYHPDVVRDDADKTKRMYEIQEAYACLGNEKSRKAYDEARSESLSGYESGKRRSQDKNQRQRKESQPVPDMGQFERFFGFQPGKGMETYQDKKNRAHKPDGPIKPEEMFAAFFGRQNHKGDRR